MDGKPPGSPDTSLRAVDEARARQARLRLREQGLIPIDPDCRIAVMLEPDELLVAVRRSVELDRRQPAAGDAGGLAGDLYVTTHRLIHLGRRTLAFELGEIREADLAADRLLLQLRDGRAVAIAVGDPRHLRVEIAAARATARASSGGRRWGQAEADAEP
jgi:hypothetical protein